MDVIRGQYATTCTLREYVHFYIDKFEASDSLNELLDTTLVACPAGTNLHLEGCFNLAKVSSNSEPLEAIIAEAAVKGNARDNILSRGFRRCNEGDDQSRASNLMANVVKHCHNSMVAYVQRPEFEELHGLLGTDVFHYVLKSLSLFVKRGKSAYIQVSGMPLNEFMWNDKEVAQEPKDEGWFNKSLKLEIQLIVSYNFSPVL